MTDEHSPGSNDSIEERDDGSRAAEPRREERRVRDTRFQTWREGREWSLTNEELVDTLEREYGEVVFVAQRLGFPEEFVPVQGTSGSFRGKVLRLENLYYHTVYVDRVRTYVFGRSPEPQRKTKVRRSRLRIRADYAPIRNVIAIARQYEAYLKEPGIYTYRQAAEHFGISKVVVSYHLALLSRLPADFVAWLEACTEDLPLAFFSLRRLRPVTMLPEPERKGALLELARTLVREMEGQPSEAVPELLWMLDDELHQMPRRLLRSIMLD